jgi:hypothetical protein
MIMIMIVGVEKKQGAKEIKGPVKLLVPRENVERQKLPHYYSALVADVQTNSTHKKKNPSQRWCASMNNIKLTNWDRSIKN